MAQDYYNVLGVSRSATQEEIRKAFKKIARENHPDVKPDDKAAAERFKAAAEAYDVLGDADTRKKYDQFGANWKHAEKAGQYGGGNPFRSGGPVDVDLRDIFGGRGAVDLGDIFGSFFGGGGGGVHPGQQAPRPQKGQDIKTSIQIPFQMAATGGSYDLNINNQRLTAQIPAGIESGKSIRLSGQGHPGQHGAPNGDLLVTVHVMQHPYFRRDGSNVLVDVPVTITEAALGAKIDVPTLTEGTVTMTLPPGTSSGAKLRLKGKGFMNLKTKQPGDQLAVIKIVVPKEIDERSRELLEELAPLIEDSPRKMFEE